MSDGGVLAGQDRKWQFEVEDLRDVFTGNLGRMGAHEDHTGGMWLYDYGRGLFHVNAKGGALRLTAEDGFPGERVACFFEDREGNCWAGLDSGGLARVRARTFLTVSASDGNFPKAAKTVCEDQHGTVWIGTLGAGLLRWKTGTVTNESLSDDPAKGFVFCVCPDNAGRIWASMGDEDLFVRDHEFKRVQPAVHGVKSILADHAGKIWVGTKSGLFVADGSRPESFQAVVEASPGAMYARSRKAKRARSGRAPGTAGFTASRMAWPRRFIPVTSQRPRKSGRCSRTMMAVCGSALFAAACSASKTASSRAFTNMMAYPTM